MTEQTATALDWLAGWGRCDLGIKPRGYAMHGYGLWQHRAHAQKTPLYARALFLGDHEGQALYFCCLDMGYVTHAIREGVCQKMREWLGDSFREERLVLTCTHTHSGPGGCTQDAFYNVVTPGYRPDHVELVVQACLHALQQAQASAAPTSLNLARGFFDDQIDVAWNRSLNAYNQNSDVKPRPDTETHLALNREMQVLALKREGDLVALLSLFGVHATCVGNSQPQHCGDNKGYAAAHAESLLVAQGKTDAVTIFAQSTAGDVSPHYHGPGQMARRKKIKGEAEYRYAQNNGELQSHFALNLAHTAKETPVSGTVDAILSYVDFSNVHAEPRFAQGQQDAFTAPPCHGVAFFTGTPVDGPGMSPVLGFFAKKIAHGLRQYRLSHPEKYSDIDNAYYQRLYAAQGPKAILLEAEKKQILGQPLEKLAMPDLADPLVKELKAQARRGAIKQSALVPSVLPLQIIRLGRLAIVCAPGEFTTTAGERLRATVEESLKDIVDTVLICTYCNEYMGYVTTFEEYQVQAYEGGHTIFGQWTLAGFQTCFSQLATQLKQPLAARTHDQKTRPALPPAHELDLRSNLAVPR